MASGSYTAAGLPNPSPQVPPEEVPLCWVVDCVRPTYNGKPNKNCCRTCAETEGRKHGLKCSKRYAAAMEASREEEEPDQAPDQEAGVAPGLGERDPESSPRDLNDQGPQTGDVEMDEPEFVATPSGEIGASETTRDSPSEEELAEGIGTLAVHPEPSFSGGRPVPPWRNRAARAESRAAAEGLAETEPETEEDDDSCVSESDGPPARIRTGRRWRDVDAAWIAEQAERRREPESRCEFDDRGHPLCENCGTMNSYKDATLIRHFCNAACNQEFEAKVERS